jgi:hypothetical protein
MPLSLILISAASTAASESRAGAGQAPRIVGAEYYEDLEDGKRYNVLADVSRKPEDVTAKLGALSAKGRLSRHIGPGGGPRKGKSWFFRQKRFVKSMRADLAADGVATLKIRARNGAGVARKLCTLRLEPDDTFGDFAGGECKRA